jgi:hypothetical protein
MGPQAYIIGSSVCPPLAKGQNKYWLNPPEPSPKSGDIGMHVAGAPCKMSRGTFNYKPFQWKLVRDTCQGHCKVWRESFRLPPNMAMVGWGQDASTSTNLAAG